MKSTVTIKSAFAVSLVALLAAGCKHGEDPAGHVAGWSLIEPSQRHPIIVSQQPSQLTLRVPRGSHGLTPSQRAQVVDFANRHRGSANSGSKLVVSVPSGGANEIAAMSAVEDLRGLAADSGVNMADVTIEAYHAEGDPQPPIRISYLRYVAQGPECGIWPTNLSSDTRNLGYENLGCAQQRNLAAQVANPADLVAPRTMTDIDGNRRTVTYDKWRKGESTVSKKDQDERLLVKGGM
jgi:pilus assembly protein CpaD